MPNMKPTVKPKKSKSKSEMTSELVKERLAAVVDPELGIDIVSLGLVYDVKVTPHPKKSNKKQIQITMTLTTPGCPLAGTIDYMVRQSLADLPSFDAHKDLKIELTFDPPWTPDMMTQAARLSLGM